MWYCDIDNDIRQWAYTKIKFTTHSCAVGLLSFGIYQLSAYSGRHKPAEGEKIDLDRNQLHVSH